MDRVVSELEYLRAWKRRQELCWMPCGCSVAVAPGMWGPQFARQCCRCKSIAECEDKIRCYLAEKAEAAGEEKRGGLP